MYLNKMKISGNDDSIESKLRHFDILKAEANTVREKDKILIRSLFKNFYKKKINVGIGFQRAYGAILAGDYFDLIKLPDKSYMFVFADVSGHGLPAYTTLIRLRSAITLAVKDMTHVYETSGLIDMAMLIKDISTKFTDIMDEAGSDDFACVNFTIMYDEDDKLKLKFYNRSMLFPIVVRKTDDGEVNLINLNNDQEGWSPQKGYLLGSDLRKLLKDNYLDIPECEFVLYEGDSILFYSDGIIEAYNTDLRSDDFGDERLEKVLKEHAGLFPQVIVDELFHSVYEFIGDAGQQKDDMTAVLINFPEAKKK